MPGYSKWPLPSGFATKALYAFLITPMYVTLPCSSYPLDLILLIFYTTTTNQNELVLFVSIVHTYWNYNKSKHWISCWYSYQRMLVRSKTILLHAMDAHGMGGGGEEEQLLLIDEFSARNLPCFTASTHWIGGWVGLRAHLGAEDRRKILSSCRGLNPSCPVYG
jgi:hypothetical protein